MHIPDDSLIPEGKLDYALDYLRNGLFYNSTDFNLLYNYAAISEAIGQYDEALRYFQLVLNVRPK